MHGSEFSGALSPQHGHTIKKTLNDIGPLYDKLPSKTAVGQGLSAGTEIDAPYA